MRRNLRLLGTVYRTGGVSEVIKRLGFRFFHRHTFSIYRLALDGSLPTPPEPNGVEIKEVTRDELHRLRQGRTDLHEYFYRDETEQLDRAWVGLKDGRLGFICWVSYSGSDLIRCGPGEAKVSYIYCMHELRGRHLTSTVVLVIARALYGHGFTSLFAVPDSDNPPIVKSFIKSGFTKVGTIRRFGLFHWPRIPVDCAKLP